MFEFIMLVAFAAVVFSQLLPAAPEEKDKEHMRRQGKGFFWRQDPPGLSPLAGDNVYGWNARKAAPKHQSSSVRR